MGLNYKGRGTAEIRQISYFATAHKKTPVFTGVLMLYAFGLFCFFDDEPGQ